MCVANYGLLSYRLVVVGQKKIFVRRFVRWICTLELQSIACFKSGLP